MTHADRIALYVWLVLILLTAATYLLGRFGLVGPAVVPVLLGTVIVKGQLLASHFMGLKHVRSPWRWVVTVWLLAIVGLISVAYWMGAE
ncbi:MAG: cytochrome C oxidase subunit IV family protein [Pseudomonadota bacterium]